MKTPILGGQYIASSSNAAGNRMVNLFPEIIPEGGKEPGFLVRCPGLVKQKTIGSGPIRGLLQVNGIAYAVSGSEFYSITSDYTVTLLGTVTGSGLASLAENGIQIFIACNPDGFIYNIATGVFAQISDPDFPGAVTVDYIDGYFTFNQPDSQLFWVTSLLDGTAIDPLEFSSAEGNPDNLIAIKVINREVWLFGTDSVEVFYNSGALAFPLTRIQGAFIETGCAAAHSVATLDNSLFWLGSDDRGSGMIYRAEGYIGRRISNHSVETIIQGFSTISDAVAYTYQQSGHSFYVITFPTEGRTFAFDVSTALWHERAGYNDTGFIRHQVETQMVFNNKVHVGDYSNGNIYTFDLNVYTDNGKVQRWLRAWRAIPTGKNNLKYLIHHILELDCESGVGLNTGQGQEALINLRWSDDGGHTWSGNHIRSLGKLGEFASRVIWRRLGRSRDRIYEVSGTDPNKIIIMGAELTALSSLS